MSRITNSDRAIVERAAKDEAALFGVSFSDVLMMSMKPPAIAARRRAWDRIRHETGWTRYRVAQVWGCDYQAVCQAPPGRVSPIYDARTVHQLQWLHGADHAAAIIREDCPVSNADIAVWRNLGRRAAA